MAVPLSLIGKQLKSFNLKLLDQAPEVKFIKRQIL